MSDSVITLSEAFAPVGFYDTTVATIKNRLEDIAHSYLEVAFNVYLLYKRLKKDGKKAPYPGIVEACQSEFGFKRSTTYNFLNIVKTYGVGKDGKISLDNLLLYGSFGYSQLVEMLSLGEEQRSEITPDTPVSSIRMLKKSNEKDKPEVVQTSEKSSSASEPFEAVQTFGLFNDIKSSDDNMTFFSGDFICSFSKSESGDIELDINTEFMALIDEFSRFMDDFSTDLTVYNDFKNARCFLSSLELSYYKPSDFKDFFDKSYPLYCAVHARYLELSEGGDEECK